MIMIKNTRHAPAETGKWEVVRCALIVQVCRSSSEKLCVLSTLVTCPPRAIRRQSNMTRKMESILDKLNFLDNISSQSIIIKLQRSTGHETRTTCSEVEILYVFERRYEWEAWVRVVQSCCSRSADFVKIFGGISIKKMKNLFYFMHSSYYGIN